MSFWTNFLNKIRLARLYSKLKKRDINKKFHNFETAKNIGIIFNAKEEKYFYLIKEITDFLDKKGIKFKTFTYLQIKKQPENQMIADYVLTNKDLNWLGCPRLDKIKDFTDESFDILILLSEKEDFVLQYVFALTKAELKVSPHYKNLNFADLMFSLKSHHTLETFVESIKKYLLEIQTQQK